MRVTSMALRVRTMAKKKTTTSAEPVSVDPAAQPPAEGAKDLDTGEPMKDPGFRRPINPIAAAFMAKPPDHDFTLDVAALSRDLDGTPDIDEYSRLLAVEVHRQMVQDTA